MWKYGQRARDSGPPGHGAVRIASCVQRAGLNERRVSTTRSRMKPGARSRRLPQRVSLLEAKRGMDRCLPALLPGGTAPGASSASIAASSRRRSLLPAKGVVSSPLLDRAALSKVAACLSQSPSL
ncbi:unnamed protein product [Lampetra planeri]